MKFTLSWLKNSLETDASVDTISDALTSLGLEVESVTDYAAVLKDFTVAEIVEAVPHPKADRLRVCQVNTKDGVKQIVCGAPNARAGIKVVLASPNTIIPANGMVIKISKIRDVESNGMLCSFEELGIAGDSEGIIELSGDAKIGTSAAAALGLDDAVIEIAITPNRGDCLSVHGIARDLAARGIGRLKPLEPVTLNATTKNPYSITLNTPACAFFATRLLISVQNKPSPEWLQNRLKALGLKPISAVVDVTNFVMLSLGQPLHAFDAAKIAGQHLEITQTTGNESFSALNGNTYTLPEKAIVIKDTSGIISLAGIIGGSRTACSSDTTNILLEAAVFDAPTIALTGQALTLQTDARYRFERNVDPAITQYALDIAANLIQEICGGEISEISHSGHIPNALKTVPFDLNSVQHYGGLTLPVLEIQNILERLGFISNTDDFPVVFAGNASPKSNTPVTLTIPSWRHDISGQHDIVEEILRVAGYASIPSQSLPIPAKLPKTPHKPQQQRELAVKRLCASLGYAEAVTWSFLSPEKAAQFGQTDAKLVLKNPISADLTTMRPSLLPNLLISAQYNTAQSVRGNRLFEVAPVYFSATPDGQTVCASGIIWGEVAEKHWLSAPKSVTVFDAKQTAFAIIEQCGANPENLSHSDDVPAHFHPTRSAALKLGNVVVGYVGEIHPNLTEGLKIAAFELFLERVPYPKVKTTKTRQPLKNSAFQPVSRDFAFVVDESLAAETLLKTIRLSDRAMISHVSVFDVYQGKGVAEGKKSLAVAVRFEPTEKTLEEADLQALSGKIIAAAEKVGAILRG
jgi:phenylalanyl-tRNA synthetase beta chain